MPNKVSPGMKFRSVIGDTQAEWIVHKKRGEGVWECYVSPEDEDYAGQRDVFTEQRILQSANIDNVFADIDRKRRAFWDAQQPGTILYVNLGRGKFASGVVEVAETQFGLGNHLRPTAIMGDWRESDLPGWHAAGFLRAGDIWCRYVLEGQHVRPDLSNIIGSPAYAPSRAEQQVDPASLPLIDLQMREPDASLAETIRLNCAYNEILDILRQSPENTAGYTTEDWADKYRSRMAAVAGVIERVGVEPSPGEEEMRSPAP